MKMEGTVCIIYCCTCVKSVMLGCVKISFRLKKIMKRIMITMMTMETLGARL